MQNLILHTLINELSFNPKKKIEKKFVIDTLEIARNKFPGSGISLDALCKRFRIDNSRRIKHTAVIDCELLSKVYINLIDQKNPLFNFKSTANLNSKNSKKFSREYCKEIISPTPEELELHKKLLVTLKKLLLTYFLIVKISKINFFIKSHIFISTIMY